jgi:hypothetical protein
MARSIACCQKNRQGPIREGQPPARPMERHRGLSKGKIVISEARQSMSSTPAGAKSLRMERRRELRQEREWPITQPCESSEDQSKHRHTNDKCSKGKGQQSSNVVVSGKGKGRVKGKGKGQWHSLYELQQSRSQSSSVIPIIYGKR